MNKDYLFIENFELACHIGTSTEEQAFPQILSVSIRAELPLIKPGQSDNLRDTADYAAIIEDARKTAGEKKFNLVESLAELIAEKVLNRPLIEAVEIKIEKKVFTGIKSVGAFIRRERNKRF